MSETLRVLITLEREAYGMDDKEKDEQPELAGQLASFMSQLHGSGAGRLPTVPRKQT